MALLRAQDQEDRDVALKTIAERPALQGRLEGQANLILMLLEERFGLLPAEAVERDRSADIAESTAWSKSFLHARDLDGVFGSSAAH